MTTVYPNTRTEYGVRLIGGNVHPQVSRHVAERKAADAIADGANPSNTYVVRREVTDWQHAGEKA